MSDSISPTNQTVSKHFNEKHGHWKNGKPSRTWKSWESMISRCTNFKNKDWHNYGGRGITVCERWLKFENFLEDMGQRPEGKTLDRIKINGNYERSNCKWSTYQEQGNNTRRSKIFTIKGVTGTIAQLERHFGLKPSCAWHRIAKRGWTPEEAFLTPSLRKA